MSFEALKADFMDLSSDAIVVGHRAPEAKSARFVFVNKAFTQLFGYQPAQVIGKDIDMLHDPESWPASVAQAQPLLNPGAVNPQVDAQMIRADGTAFWASISFSVMEDPTAEGQHIAATFRDISALKASESRIEDALQAKSAALADQQARAQALEAQQARHITAMNALPDPLAIYDGEGRLYLWNTAFLNAVTDDPTDIFRGISQAEILPLATRKNRVSIPDQERGEAFVHQLYHGDPKAGVTEIETAEGQHFRILNIQVPTGDRIIMRFDITEMVSERRAADQAHARLLSALNAYPDPISIYDAQNRLVCWNEAYRQSITSNPAGLKEGMDLRNVLERALAEGKYPEAAGNEQDWINQTLKNATKDSELRDIELEGDVHHRLMRSRTASGDHIIVRLNATEFVRQKRAAEATETRLIAALNAYPSPFVIYDAQDCLVVWNKAYRDSMTDDPNGLKVGMHRTDAAREAIRCGKIAEAIGREEEFMQSAHLEAEMDKPVQDLELAGDIHHRLLRTRSENGDLVMLRIDTTELVRQRRALEKTQQRLISAINAYPDHLAIYDADLKLAIWNPAFTTSVSRDPRRIRAGMHVKDILLLAAREGRIPEAIGREDAWVADFISQDRVRERVYDLRESDGQHYRFVFSPTEDRELVVLRINITEVVEQRQAVERYAKQLELANQEVLHKALHDELTGLGNRRHLSERFQEMRDKRRAEGGEIAALHIDLDRFKQINDTMGHLAGDTVLTVAAERICEAAKPQDVIARIGGDEFIVLLHVSENCPRPETLAHELLEALSRPTIFAGKECRFGASIGLAITPLSDEDQLLTNSDVALYKAKNRGRNQVGIFDLQDLKDVHDSKALADDLLRAAEEREFIPYYQPQVDAATGEVVGLEALARWQHPEKGILTPDYFLSAATDLNLAAEIDRMIFEKAICECQEAFGDAPSPPSLSFNVSAKRVNGDEFEAIRTYVKSYSGQICFELLETIFLEEEDQEFLFQLDRMRDIGISIEVDDFGSGRASIVALQRIAPDRVKIDRRLVTNVASSDSGLRLSRAIIEIGLALDMGITAEGVETKEQAESLAALGCDRLQGYYFSKPMCFEDLIRFYEDDRAERRRG
ncbi:MAG: EAL domain-containing protein [Pseudomonadota bacterium]